jgi:hypothetical protein
LDIVEKFAFLVERKFVNSKEFEDVEVKLNDLRELKEDIEIREKCLAKYREDSDNNISKISKDIFYFSERIFLRKMWLKKIINLDIEKKKINVKKN